MSSNLKKPKRKVQQVSRNFHIGDIISIVNGKLLSPNRMGGIYEILNGMIDHSVFTHQISYVINECRPFILAQYPELADVDTQNFNEKNLSLWLR